MPKSVLITGCSSGFGRAAALHLVKRGWQVFATVRTETDRAALFEAARAQGGREKLAVFLCDITDDAQVRELGELVRAVTARLDGLVNNAGSAYAAPLELLPLEDLRAQLDLNVVGQLAVTQALLPLLKAARGTIVNVSSPSGRIAFPVTGAYNMSKFALEAMSDTLRLELAPFGVRVVVIEPGSSATAIWETSRRRSEQRLAERGIEPGPYQPLVDAVIKQAFVNLQEASFPPERFAEMIEKILNSRRPRARYVLPRRIGWLIAARRWAPDGLWDWFVRRSLRW